MLWIVFNKDGQLINSYNVGNLPFAGTNDFQMFAIFKDISTVYTGASMKLYKPDLEHTSYVPLIMSHTSKVFDGETNVDLQNGVSYAGFYFDFSNYEGPSLLDTAGLWRAVITLFHSTNENVRDVVGSVMFSVGNGTVNLDGTEISDDEVIEEIYAAIATKLDINGPTDPKYIKVISTDNIDSYVFNTNFSVGDIVLNRNNGNLYKLGEASDELYPEPTGLILKNVSVLEDVFLGGDSNNYTMKLSLSNDNQTLTLESDTVTITLNAETGALSINSVSLKWNNKDIATEEFVENYVKNRAVYISSGVTSGTFTAAEINTLLKYGSTIIVGNNTRNIYIKEQIGISNDNISNLTFRRINETTNIINGAYHTYKQTIYVIISSGVWTAYSGEYIYYTTTKADELLDLKADKINTPTNTDLQDAIATVTALANSKSVVTGTYEGAYWKTITIDGTTKNLGAGGGANLTAGYGIDIQNDEISVDTDVIANKDFVNSSIATQTANFLGTFNIVTDLGLTTSATEQEIIAAIATEMQTLSITPTNNDYVYVSYPNATVSTQFDKFDRYKYNAEEAEWAYEYTLNNSSFTAEQWAAINSGITSGILSGLARESEIADQYSDNATYSIGDLVIYNNTLYKCTTAITIPESFDSTHWTATTIENEFVNLSGSQTISGVKTFNEIDIKVSNDNSKIAKIVNVGNYYLGIKANNDNRMLIDFASESVLSTNLLPLSNNSRDLGSSFYKWKNIYLSGGFNPNENGYKLTIPDTTSWTANKEIATTDQIPQIMRFI